MRETILWAVSSGIVGIGIGYLIKSAIVNSYRKYRKESETLRGDQLEFLLEVAVKPKPEKYDREILIDLLAIVEIDKKSMEFLYEKASPWAKAIIF